MGLNYFTINGNDSNCEKEGMILEPNYQPEPPSNQNGDREDEDFKFTPKELSRMYLDELLNQTRYVIDLALNPAVNKGITKIATVYLAIDKLSVIYGVYSKHEIESQEI